jgi:hypothetical protein
LEFEAIAGCEKKITFTVLYKLEKIGATGIHEKEKCAASSKLFF